MDHPAKPSIVYIDDEEINLYIFNQMFGEECEIHTFLSAQEALIHLQSNDVDLVVTDQLMPAMSGVEFLRRIKEVFPDLNAKKVMVSGFAKNADIQQAMEEKLLHKFIKKPWSYDDLKDVIFENL